MRHFVLSAIRNIKKNPLISLINLWGLVLGFMCVIFIIFWTKNELSYDRFHKNSHKIYRIHRYWYNTNGSENLHLPYVAPVIAPLIKNDFPEIESIARIFHTDLVFSAGGPKMIEKNGCFAEPEVLRIFDFSGLPADKDLLIPPFTMIVSDEVSRRYFGESDASGKYLEFKDDNGKKYAFRVTGVFKSWKGRNHFNPDFFISFSTLESFFGKDEFKNWGSNNYETFALISKTSADLDKKLDLFIDKYLDNGSKWTKIRMERLTDIHFNWFGSRSYIYILVSVAVLILIIGCINYMNLNAAIYLKRLKEIKIKKLLGASQGRLAFQLLAESLLFCLIALIIAIYLTSAVSGFIRISDVPLIFKISENLNLITGFVLLSLLTGLVSGIYPVFILASFRPSSANVSDNLKGRKTIFRNTLVVFQFIVSTGLIISFLVVSRQLNYINDKELGFDKDNVIIIPATPLLIEKLEVFRQQLTQNPDILAVSASKRVPSEGLLDSDNAKIVADGTVTPLGFRMAHIRIDGQFIPTYKIDLLAGRNFYDNISSDSGYIINEAAVKKIGWKSPAEAIDRIIEYGSSRGKVIGVVRDFHYESLHNPVSPVIMNYDPGSFNRVALRVNSSDMKNTLSLIEKTWQAYNVSEYPFTYEYLDDRFRQLYSAEEKMKIIFTWFMIVAISIAILGMVGLSAFLIERRTKEIGIRKINGATVSEIMILLNSDLIRWVAIAFVLAVPIGWYAMHKWLGGFAYKTDLPWWIFILAGLLAAGIALLTVSWQSWRAAAKNPVETLRYE